MTGKGRELVDVMMRREIDVMCVQETRWKGKSARELGEGYKIFYSGENDGKNGVGVILSSTMKSKVVDVQRPGDRMMMVKVLVGSQVLNVISAYAPQAGRSTTEKESFFEALEQMVLACPQQESIVVGADMNGHVGEKRAGFSANHGGKGYGVRNEEGERLLECCESLDLALTNTFFTKKREHLITYKSGDHQTQIDYILIRRRELQKVKNCGVTPGEAAVPQHRLLSVRMRLAREERRKKTHTQKRIKTWKLKDPGTNTEYQQAVKAKYGIGATTAEQSWQDIKTAVVEAATKTCGRSKGRKRETRETWWWNVEVRAALKEKKEAFKNWQKARDIQTRTEYGRAKNKAKKTIGRAKEGAWRKWYEELGTPEGERRIYQIANQRAGSQRDIKEMTVIKDSKGDILTEENQIKTRWRDYFKQLLNAENEREKLTEVKPSEGPIENITVGEIKEAMRKMKKGKATGCSEVSIDLIWALQETGEQMVLKLMELIWSEEMIPEEWGRSEIVPIYKQKGDPLECGKYRGIKLLEHLLKIMERVLDQRLRKLIEIDEMQYGFQRGRGTTDAIFVVKQLQEKYLEKQKDLYFAFVDLEKAYDRIPRELVYWCLRKRGVPERTVRLVQATYKNASTVVRTSQGQTKPFHIRVGLHQGSALSPFLFVMVMDTITKQCRKGLPWEVLFADDLVIIAESECELQRKVLEWQRGMANQGLKVNTGKTEVMVCSRVKRLTNIVDGSNIKLDQVQSFKYLGLVLSEEGKSEEAVKARVTAAWNKWKEVRGVVGDRKMPRKLKVKIYETVIRPVLTYGAEVWTVRKKEERLLETTEMRMLRRIRGVTLRDRMRSNDIRSELGVENITSRIRTSRLRWFGHVKRMKETSWARRAMEMEVDGRRSRGRPSLRWRDNINSDMKMRGVREGDTQDRALWRRKIRTPDPD